MLDLDHFKHINDTHGHAAGDQVLRTVAQRCAVTIREVDVLGRYGGEEFTLVLPGTDPGAAYQLAERLRQRIAEPIESGTTALIITASLGVVGLTEESSSLASLLEQADAALYRAKAGGRNRVEVKELAYLQDQPRQQPHATA
jgi:diguanylate cyclase (GGDEF)-like protein